MSFGSIPHFSSEREPTPRPHAYMFRCSQGLSLPAPLEQESANEKMVERSFDSFVGQDIEFSYKMGLEGLHGYYFTFSYAARYISRSFDQFCFLYFCSGFSLEDF